MTKQTVLVTDERKDEKKESRKEDETTQRLLKANENCHELLLTLNIAEPARAINLTVLH